MTPRKEAYEAYIASDAWQAKRQERLNLDSHQCQRCGATDHLHVHHCHYKNFGHEDIGDIVTVCVSCHEAIHKAYKKSRHETLSEITAKVLRFPPVITISLPNVSKKKPKVRKSDGKGARKHVVS